MSSAFALSKDEVQPFTPASLANIHPLPVFRFRPATKRDGRKYGHLLSLEGLRMFQPQAIRAEVLKVLERNWDGDTFAANKQRLETAWEMMEQGIDLDPEEGEAIAELVLRCTEVSPMLRRMDTDNRRFAEEAPGIALALFLVGWTGLETPFRLAAGVVSLDTMDDLRGEIVKIEERAAADKVAGVVPGMGFMQLTLHAFSLLNVDKDEEKNSSAPSPSSETQSGSKTRSPRAGKSKGGGAPTRSRARKTRATSSRKNIKS